ncbi:MAG: hypothetical protein D6696_16645 [Acidobacteria bacterium]|nr:MAG: hypothetical protein D6696_16645 [Acidobacteriota bacterium]
MKHSTRPSPISSSLSRFVLIAILAVLGLSLALPLTRGESPIDLGLDLGGGVIVTYRPDLSSRLAAYRELGEDELLGLAKETLQSRLYRRLSTVPDVVVRSDQRIVVSIPGQQDAERILELMGRTYHLTMRLVVDDHPQAVAERQLYPYHGRLLELAPPAVSGDMLDLRSIRAVPGQPGALDERLRWAQVAFRLQPPHDRSFAELTRRNVGKTLAILLDERVEWAGRIESAIDGDGVLSGGYSLEEAQEISRMLRSGTLPTSLEVESLSAVGPSLGQEIAERGWRAALLALAALAGLLGLAYLHRAGLLVAALVSLACLIFAIAGLTAAFGLTLDLVGIAGLVLSVGMGMDAFLLVFESLEARLGEVTPRWLAHHRRGVARALYAFAGEGRTLLHANATTLVVVGLLLATERLASFALFIFVGIGASILTIFVTREVLAAVPGLSRWGRDPLAWLRDARWGLYRWHKVYFAFLVVALAATVLAPLRPGTVRPLLELGSDFKPGTQLIVSSPEPQRVDAAVDDLHAALPQVEIRRQSLGEPASGRFLVTLGTTLEPALAGLREGGALAGIFADHSLGLEGMSTIDGRVSSRRLLSSLAVLGLSVVFLALYLVACQGAIDRFLSRGRRGGGRRGTRLWVFAGVLLALVVDVAVVLAALAWLGIPIGLPVVAALLTIVGYSVNDSVVLWSHVQDRWAAARAEGGGESPARVVSDCVDRILSRACLTSLSTMVPALMILVVGLSPLAGFAWAMIAGTVSGTLSSLFIVGSFATRALALDAGRAGSTIAERRPVTT